MDPKEAAARKALERVEDGMTIGLGTGSTAVFFIRALGEKMRAAGWTVRGVPTSERSGSLAQEVGIPVVDLPAAGLLDLTIDGADEADGALNLIKGGGGALLREKLVAADAREFIVICDYTKFKETLGAFPLPVAIVPYGWGTTAARLARYGVEINLRQTSIQLSGQKGMNTAQPPQGRAGGGAVSTEELRPFVTDDGLYILDMHFGRIEDPARLEREIKQTTGVVDVGLFVGLTSRLILGYEDGHTDTILPKR